MLPVFALPHLHCFNFVWLVVQLLGIQVQKFEGNKLKLDLEYVEDNDRFDIAIYREVTRAVVKMQSQQLEVFVVSDVLHRTDFIVGLDEMQTWNCLNILEDLIKSLVIFIQLLLIRAIQMLIALASC